MDLTVLKMEIEGDHEPVPQDVLTKMYGLESRELTPGVPIDNSNPIYLTECRSCRGVGHWDARTLFLNVPGVFKTAVFCRCPAGERLKAGCSI